MKNKSGIHPAGDRILIKPDEVEKAYDGVIQIPDTVKSTHAMAQTIGVLVEAGPDCWVDHVVMSKTGEVTTKEVHGFSRPFAKPGDRVCFAKYGGLQVTGKDGEEYRIMNDVDITALVEEGVDFSGLKARKPFAA